jgi:hypothetical protein
MSYQIRDTVRLPPALGEEVDKWASAQADAPTRSEAIRRLVELGLTVKARLKQSAPARAERAKDLAAKVIDSFPLRPTLKRQLAGSVACSRDRRSFAICGSTGRRQKPNDQAEAVRRAAGRGRGRSKGTQSDIVETDYSGKPSRS